MDDIVAIKVYDKRKGSVAFLTWGRIFDVNDPKELIDAVRPHLHKYGLDPKSKMELCDTLQRVSNYTYFYEAYAKLVNQKRQLGKPYKRWLAKIRKQILHGNHLYFIQGKWRPNGVWVGGWQANRLNNPLKRSTKKRDRRR